MVLGGLVSTLCLHFRFGHPDMRASYSERVSARQRPSNGGRAPSEAVYKSNSSLDLDHEADILQESSVGQRSPGERQQRREYGSHGSLDMMGRGHTNGGEASGLFAQPGDGPVAVSTLTRAGAQYSHLDRSEDSTGGSVISTGSQDMAETDGGLVGGGWATSPKTKRKAITGFWGSNSKDKNSRKSQKSLFKKRPKDGVSEGAVKGSEALAACDMDNKAEDKHRRRFFSHYDTASVCASLSVTAQLRTLQRRNTTTGASAASAALRGGNTGDSLDTDAEADTGDGVNNDCVLR